jgi:hypothetical protein
MNRKNFDIYIVRFSLSIVLIYMLIILCYPNTSLSQTNFDLPSKVKVLILDPYSVDVKIASTVYDYLKGIKDLEIKYLYGTQVTLQVFEKLSDYDVIYYSGHGTLSKESDRIAIGTGQLYSESKEREYRKMYGSNYERYLYPNNPKSKPKQKTFWITSDFIRDLSGKLKAAVVYFDACETFKKKTMAEAFIANGVKSYLGWDKGQAAWDIGNWEPTADVAKTFLRNMLNCKSIESAFNALPYDFNRSNLKWYGEGETKLPACQEQQVAKDIIEFEVPLGKTVNGFTYSQNGELLFQGKSFHSTIKANTSDVPKFKISILRSENIAAAIAMDCDGKNLLFSIDLSRVTSQPMQASDTASAALKIFWSPSKKYMLALCSYEGERFISLDLNNKRSINGDFIGPFSDRIWRIKDNPQWMGQTDVLGFTVDEICNYYDNPNCDGKVLAAYKVRLEASSLEIKVEPTTRSNMSY